MVPPPCALGFHSAPVRRVKRFGGLRLGRKTMWAGGLGDLSEQSTPYTIRKSALEHAGIARMP